MQHEAVHDTEHRRRGANAQRQREHRDRRPDRLAAKRSQRIANVLRERVDRPRACRAALSAIADRHARGAGEADALQVRARLGQGIAFGRPARHEIASAHIEVKRELGVDVFLDVRAPEAQIASPGRRAGAVLRRHLTIPVESHQLVAGSVSSTFDTAPAKRAQ